ncbi:MAG: peptidylprolyl isomerase, partial [Pseudomonas sp.]|uniref:peptidylprolyl isomerase n=1 Tax=Pseudomonas sp. TaxID=306 RepID=UPI003C728AA1
VPAGTLVADGLGDSFMYQDYYGDQVPEQLASVFGTQFAQALFQLEPGAWQGPVESGLGWHLVYIDSLTPGRVPIFEEVEPMVRAEWINAQRAEATRKIYAAMRERYEVLLPAPGAIADAEPGHDLP